MLCVSRTFEDHSGAQQVLFCLPFSYVGIRFTFSLNFLWKKNSKLDLKPNMRFRSLSSRDFFRQFARNAYLEMLQVLCKEGALTLKPHYTYGAQSSGLMILRSLRVNLSKVGTDRKCFKSPNWQKIELRLGRRKHPWANTCWLFCFSSNRAYTWLSKVASSPL